MSVSATDPFWTALASYDLGTGSTLGTTTAATANSASAASSSVAARSSAVPSSGTGASTSSATGSSTSGSSAIANLLDAGPSGVAVAVRAAVDNRILDAML